MQHLSEDIRREIPGAGCFSRINLYYMRWFFELYCMRPIVPQAGEQSRGQLAPIVPQVGEQLPVEAYQVRFPNVTRMLLSVPWGHHKVIIDKFKGRQDDALFYVRKIVENGWSRSMLEHWIGTNLHLREGNAVTNFDSLAEIDGGSDLANELLKDPYDFSFLSLTEKYREQDFFLATFPAVAVEGPKWCGKTWTSTMHSKSAFMLADPANNFSNREIARLDVNKALEGDAPHLVDEWQEVPAIWDAVRYKSDERSEKGNFRIVDQYASLSMRKRAFESLRRCHL